MARLALIMLLSAWLSGCASVAYVGQAARGQAEVLNKARPIAELIADPTTPEPLRSKLRFAQRHCGNAPFRLPGYHRLPRFVHRAHNLRLFVFPWAVERMMKQSFAEQ